MALATGKYNLNIVATQAGANGSPFTQAVTITVAPATSANNATVTSVGPAIVDASGNQWTITSGAQVALNGTAVSITSNVVELAYVSGSVWQLNTSGNWYQTLSVSGGTVTYGSATTTSPLPASGGSSTGVAAARMFAFLNTIGVNGQIQSYGSGAAYTNTTGIVADAEYIGAKKWRDGLYAATSGAQLTAITALANAGFKFSLVPTNFGDNPYTAVISNLLTQAQTINSAGPGNTILALEGPNEPINWGLTYNGVTGGGGQPWNAVAAFQAAYYAAIKADSALSGIPVWSLTLTGAETPNVGVQYLTVPNGSSASSAVGTVFADVENIHIYPFYNGAVGFIDPSSSVYEGVHDQFVLELTQSFVTTYAQGYAGYSLTQAEANPKVITEFGLSTSQGGMDATTRAKNLCNAYLIAYADGWQAAFCYELYNENDGYGLFTGTGQPTTAATYLHNMYTILNDTGSTAATFTPGLLPYTLSGLPSTGMSLLFQKSNGHFQLVLWRNETNFNYSTQQPIAITAANVTIALTTGSATFNVYSVASGTSATQTATAATSTVVPVADYPTIVDIAYSAPSASTGPAASGTFVNVDFTSLTGQTVQPYVWGVATGTLGDNNFANCANTTLQSTLSSLAFLLYRFNCASGYTETAFPSGATTSSNLATVFGPLINNAHSFMPAGARVIIGLGNPPSNWSSAANFAAMCAAVATYFKNTNSTATGVPLPVYGFEIGNETDGGSGNAPSYYYSYFNAAAAAIKGVSSSFKVLGPVFSYVSDLSGFTAGCSGHFDVLDYHYYTYAGQSGFTSAGGVSAMLAGGGSNTLGSNVANAVSGSTPIFIGEYNQNDTYGTNSGGASPGVCNTYMANIVGAVFNAQSILSALNASNNFQMAGIWEVFEDSDYGVVGATDVSGGGTYTVSPGGYLLSKAAATVYGARATTTLGSANPPLNCISVVGGPGATNFALMMINYSQSTAYAGQVGLSHWPINTTGSASIHQWTISPANPNGVTTSLAVTGGLTGSISVPAESVVIIYN